MRRPLPGWFVPCVLAVLIAACTGTTIGPRRSAEPLPTGLVGALAPTAGPRALRYVALGDPYPFGDGVQQSDRWPNQLVRILRPELDLELTANLSGRSVATQQVINDQLPRLSDLQPQFVTVQVGANDIALPDPDPVTYRDNMVQILDAVLARGVPADRIVVVTIPDFTLYPMGDIFGASAAKQERIIQYNEILRQVAGDRGVAVVDITPIADRVPDDPSLVAPDDRHPSGKQYAGWADLIATTVRGLFGIHSAGDLTRATAVPGPSLSATPAGSPRTP